MYFGASKYLRPSPAVELSVEPHFALILMLNYGDCVLWVQCLSLPSSNVTIILKTKGFYFGLIWPNRVIKPYISYMKYIFQAKLSGINALFFLFKIIFLFLSTEANIIFVLGLINQAEAEKKIGKKKKRKVNIFFLIQFHSHQTSETSHLLVQFCLSGSFSDQHVLYQAHGASFSSPLCSIAALSPPPPPPAHHQQHRAAAAEQHRDTDAHSHQQSVDGHVPLRPQSCGVLSADPLVSCRVVPPQCVLGVVGVMNADRCVFHTSCVRLRTGGGLRGSGGVKVGAGHGGGQSSGGGGDSRCLRCGFVQGGVSNGWRRCS